MTTFDEILKAYAIERVELTSWIEQRWVRPQRTPSGFVFDKVDEARVGLICELRRDMMVDEDALGLVLSLLDQLYAARQMLKTVEEAIAALPPSLRSEFRENLRRPPEG